MELSAFFDPPRFPARHSVDSLGAHLRPGSDFPDWESADLVVLGLGNPGQSAILAPAIRETLYTYSLSGSQYQASDLGDLRPRSDWESTYDALAYVIEQLLAQNKAVLMLADDASAAYGAYTALGTQSGPHTYVHLGPDFSLGDPATHTPASSVNQRILAHEPGNLEAMVQLGYQRYRVSEREREALADLEFPAIRYGDLHNSLLEAEPYFREAALTLFDLSAVRQSVCPAATNPQAGGFDALEICRLARYAGAGSRLQTLVLTGVSPEFDIRDQSSRLAATVLWYVLEGFNQRIPRLTNEKSSQMRRYEVQLRSGVGQIVFYEDNLRDLWWMEIPYPDEIGKLHPRHKLLACSHRDYESARNDEIPARWWHAFNRMG